VRVVIQCAGSKQPAAGTFWTADGRRVVFVAHPALAPRADDIHYAHPDDLCDLEDQTWRERVMDENRRPRVASSPLCAAGFLYRPSAYRTLQERFGAERLFILSAGWGLVRSNFLLPAYDITFSGSAEPHKRRQATQRFSDFNHLLDEGEADTVFLGGKDYLPLFLKLSSAVRGRRLVFFNSAVPPAAPGCMVQEFRSARRTNWHYGCAEALASGKLALNFDQR
jgi:hypothetical protein